MGYEFSNEKPIYLQIIEYIKELIVSKKFKPNEKIPSVRELSIELNVNPNTVQKALSELEESEIIYTERTNGKFVTKDEVIIERLKTDMVNKKVEEFFSSLAKIGLTREEILKIINKG